LLKKIIAWKPDIVHSNGEFFSMVFARKIVKKLSCPLIHTCHTDFSNYGKNYMKNQKIWNWVIARVVRSRLKTVDCVICPSDKMQKMLKGYGLQSPIEVIPSGIDCSHFSQGFSEEERIGMRKQFSFASDNFVFVSICRLAVEKNIKETISHFASLFSGQNRARLLIVGGGSERENLESQVAGLGLGEVIKFSGPVDPNEVWKYFRLADAFVSSSVSESQGLTYIEALSSGLPLLCKQDPSLEHTIEPGSNGFMFVSQKEFVQYGSSLVEDKPLWQSMHRQALLSSLPFGREAWGKRLLTLFEKYLDI
jgi:1,2-diacylglycerol 3-alpha-glucosyltransferase